MTNRAIYNLVGEIKGEAYVRLLHSALSYCDSFILVIRHSIDVNASAQALLNRLAPFTVDQEERNEWPGTKLLSETAQVNRFRFLPATASALAEVADGLFSWTQPQLPEDLCLIRNDGDPWLVTIAHEEDAYMIVSRDEAHAINELLPDVSLSLSVPEHVE